MKRPGAYILGRVAAILTVAVMALLYAVQTPKVQTEISKRALHRLNEQFNGAISCSEIKILPSGALMIKDLAITDNAPGYTDPQGQSADTVLTAGRITATFSLAGLFNGNGIHLGKVRIHDIYFHLVAEPNAYKANISRVFNALPAPQPAVFDGRLFDIRSLHATNVHFRLNNLIVPYQKKIEKSIDYSDLDVRAEIKGRRISYSHGVIKARASHVSLAEKSGYTLRHLSADVRVAPGKAEVKNIEIEDPWSSIRAKHYNMIFGNVFDFSRYIEKVLMEFEFRPSKVSVKTISYFAGIFENGTNILDVKTGGMRGYVNDLNITDLNFTDEASGVSASVSGNISGLPYDREMVLKAKAGNVTFTPSGLEHLLAGLVPEAGISLDFLQPHCHYRLDAEAHGPINRLHLDARLAAAHGHAHIKGEVRNFIDPKRPTMLSTTLGTSNLNLGEILGTEILGPLTANAGIKATLYPDSPEILLDSLNIKQIDALGSRYRSIRSSASLVGKRARVSIASADPKLKIRATALADLGTDTTSKQYTIEAALDSVDLYALGLDKRQVSRLSATISGDFTQRGYYVNGYGLVKNLSFENAGGERKVGDIMLTAYNFADEQHVKVKAPFANLSLTANSSPAEILDGLVHHTIGRELPAITDIRPTEDDNHQLHLDLDIHDAQELLAFVAPGVYIANGTKLCLKINDDGQVMADLNSSRIAYGTNYLRDLSIGLDNYDGQLSLGVVGSTLKIGGLELEKPTVLATATGNDISFDFDFSDCGVIGSDGHIGITGNVRRDSTGTLEVRPHFTKSYINTDLGAWLLSDSGILLKGSDIDIHRFSLSNGDQRISIDGGLSAAHSDTLSLSIRRFDLGFASVFGGVLAELEGLAAGDAEIHTGPDRALGLLLDLTVDSLRLGGADAGTLRLATTYGDGEDNLSIYVMDKLDGADILYANGAYYPAESRLDLTAHLDEFPLRLAGVLTDSFIEDLDGSLSGEINLRNSSGNLRATGEDLYLSSVTLTPTLTGVKYTLDGPLRLNGTALQLSELTIRDNEQGYGFLSGSLDFRDFRNLYLGADLSINNIKVLDSQNSSNGVYGLLRASGTANISGPLSSLDITGEVNTSGPGNVRIATFGSATGTTSDLLTFTQAEVIKDDYETMLEDLQATEEQTSNVNIRARLGLQGGIRAVVDMDKNNGNTAVIYPQGNLLLNLRPSEDVFDINGDITVNDGSYRFAIPGVLSKDFSILEGSTIRFVGNLPDTQLDINANYSLKASLETIITDTSEDVKRTVNCGINISDRLRNPRINFSIDVPNLNASARSQIESALSTDDKVQKQFVALLVLGSFLPDESSGVINSSDILYSNVTSFVSNQINNIMQKLDIPIDIGLDYHESSATGNNIFDVAISTQLFNNRVIVGGSVANRNFVGASGAAGDVIGDLDIQIKLDPAGKFRFNLFSHSADEYSSLIDLSQRNGIGVSFQREYYSLKDFAASLKKRQPSDSTAVTPVHKEMKTIKIEAEPRQ